MSPDLRYSLLFAEDEPGEVGTFIARNDGSGRCRVAVHPGQGVYGPAFRLVPGTCSSGARTPPKIRY